MKKLIGVCLSVLFIFSSVFLSGCELFYLPNLDSSVETSDSSNENENNSSSENEDTNENENNSSSESEDTNENENNSSSENEDTNDENKDYYGPNV